MLFVCICWLCKICSLFAIKLFKIYLCYVYFQLLYAVACSLLRFKYLFINKTNAPFIFLYVTVGFLPFFTKTSFILV